MTSNLSHPKYRPDIDGLRAVAVLSVVLFHAFPEVLRGGFIGVDVFFVISGFLISTIIFKSLDRGMFSIGDFYVRRIKRIFPSLLFVLVICYVIGWRVLLADEFALLGKHIASGAGFISNFTLLSEVGYFDSAAEAKPLLHLWSLGIEEQFYIVWPLVLIIAWRLNFSVFFIAIFFATISFSMNLVGVENNPTVTFYSPHTRFWELLCGSLLAWAVLYKGEYLSLVKARIDSQVSSRLSIVSNMQSISGAMILGFGFFLIDEEIGFPGKWAAVPVIGTVLLLAAGPGAWLNRVVLSHRLMVWVGLISFPLYLWHWPILTFARIIEGDIPSVKVLATAVLLSVVLAWITYRFIERPIRVGGGGAGKAYALAASMVVMGAIGYITHKNGGFEFRTFPQQVAANLGTIAGYNETMTVYGLGKCFIDYGQGVDSLIAQQCATSVENGRRLVVYGDSEAAHLMVGVRSIYGNSDFIIQQWTGTSCRPFAYVENVDRRCAEFSDRFVNSIAPDLKTGDVMIVGANWLGSYISVGEKRYEELVERFFKDIGVTSAQVIVFGNSPDFSVEPMQSVARKIIYSQERQFMQSDDYLYSNLILERLSLKYGFSYFNPSSVLCKSDRPLECLVYDGRDMTFFDRGHLSGFGSVLVFEGFAKQFSITEKE